jgi:aminoglycoside phosphotransferase (APT) family kinase protein
VSGALELELDDARRAFGIQAASVEEINAPNPAKGGRALYRVVATDGTSMKLRILQSGTAAADLQVIRAGLPAAFTPVIDRYGRVLLEPWVDGIELAELGPSPERCAEAGALLAELHRTTVEEVLPTVMWTKSARDDLTALHEAGQLDDDASRELGDALEAGDPGTYRSCVIHRDYCGVNMVVDGSGSLWVIDNEWFVLGPAGFDLGRTLHRWWMTDSERLAFLDAYGADGMPDDADHWGLVADLFGARVELVMTPETGTPILDRLLDRIGRPSS